MGGGWSRQTKVKCTKDVFFIIIPLFEELYWEEQKYFKIHKMDPNKRGHKFVSMMLLEFDLLLRLASLKSLLYAESNQSSVMCLLSILNQ